MTNKFFFLIGSVIRDFNYRQFCFLITTQIVVSVLFKFLGLYLSVDRAFFNVSYFFIPLISFGFGWLVFFLSIVFVVFDIIATVNQSGLSPLALIHLFKYVSITDHYSIMLAILVVVFFVAVLLLVYFPIKRTNFKFSILSIFIVLAVASLCKFAGLGQFSTSGIPGILLKKAIGIDYDRFLYERVFSTDAGFKPIDSKSGLSSFLFQHKNSNKLISIVVESLGYPKYDKINNYLLNIVSPVSQGLLKTGFKGVTVNGELRELCNVETDGIVITSMPRNVSCLPAQKQHKGIYTVAYHNNDGKFYDRFLWYPQVGFDEFIDGGKLIKFSGSVKSRVFSGVDDESVVNAMFNNLKDRGSYFAHWMTMDSHAPYAGAKLGGVALSRQVCDSLDVHSEMECNYLSEITNTLKLIARLHEQLPDATIVVSGDHEPHFQELVSVADIKEASSHYSDKYVMSFVIEPKGK